MRIYARRTLPDSRSWTRPVTVVSGDTTERSLFTSRRTAVSGSLRRPGCDFEVSVAVQVVDDLHGDAA
jgi:hypothetical protein